MAGWPFYEEQWFPVAPEATPSWLVWNNVTGIPKIRVLARPISETGANTEWLEILEGDGGFRHSLTLLPDSGRTYYFMRNFRNAISGEGLADTAATVISDTLDFYDDWVKRASSKGGRPKFEFPKWSMVGAPAMRAKDLRKKTTVQALFTMLPVIYYDPSSDTFSQVWLYDLDKQKPERILTLWELVQSDKWFVDCKGQTEDVRFQKVFVDRGLYKGYDCNSGPVFFEETKGTKLWPLTERMWGEGEWVSPKLGGPPAARFGMEASEANEPPFTGQKKIHVEAPPTGFPGWLLLPHSSAVQARVEPSELEEILREDGGAKPLPRETKEEKLARMGRWFIRVLVNNEAEPTEWSGTYTGISARQVYGQFEELLLPRKKPKYGMFAGMGVAHKETAFRLFRAVTITHEDSTVWLYDLDAGKPDRVLTLFELAQEKWYADGASTYFEGQTDKLSLEHKKLWPLSERMWEEGEWPQEGSGGPPAARYGMEMARENPIAAEGDDEKNAALICMGRHIIFEFDDCDDLQLPPRWGMLRDPSGTFWPSCSLLFTRFTQGSEEDETKPARNYFGRNAEILRGHVDVPPHDLKHGWREVGIVKQIFYERAGTKAPGRFKHKFNDPRGWMWLVALFKKRVSETPAVLFEYDRGGVSALRLELPDGCLVDERGIALP
jgi:hypothetical protein